MGFNLQFKEFLRVTGYEKRDTRKGILDKKVNAEKYLIRQIPDHISYPFPIPLASKPISRRDWRSRMLRPSKRKAGRCMPA